MLIFVTSARFVSLTIILRSGAGERALEEDVVLTVVAAAAAAAKSITTTISRIRTGSLAAAVEAVAGIVAEDAGSGERMMLAILTVNMHGIGLILIGRRRGITKPPWTVANFSIILPATIHGVIIVWAMMIAHARIKMNKHQLQIILRSATAVCHFALLAEMLLLAGLYGFDCVPAVKVMGWLVVFPVLLVMPQAMTSTVLY